MRLDDKKFAVTGLATGRADTLPSASAIRNDICVLQKAANGKKLSLTEASIWRISAECIGNVHTMRQALECCHRGRGESIMIGVAPSGTEISTRAFRFVTGRVWKGSAFGGARGRTDVPKIVDWYMEGKINIDDLITHTTPLDKINGAFELMHQGKSIRSEVAY